MDWKEILTQVTISLLGIVITTVSGYVIALINSKIKDEKMKKILNDALNVVSINNELLFKRDTIYLSR